MFLALTVRAIDPAAPQPERRRRPRALADFPAEILVEGGAVAASTRDISELGLRCTCARRLSVRTDVTVTFCLPGHPEALRLSGRVVRAAADDARGSTFTVGLHFTGMTPIERAAILGYVRKGRRAP